MSRITSKAKSFFLTKYLAVFLLALVQIGVFFALIVGLGQRAPYAYITSMVISVGVTLSIFDSDTMNPAYKILWLFVVALLPVGGLLMFVMFANARLTPKREKLVSTIEARSNSALVQQPRALQGLKDAMPQYAPHATYLQTTSRAPVYSSTQTTYFPDGEHFFDALCEELEKAEKFIFMEYYIIQEGSMWNKILQILRKKVAQGVTVRLVYDGFGCLPKLPEGYSEVLREYGIDAHEFNPIKLNVHISEYAFLNHRDHRKITVIDGNVGFNGGLNLADEYINAVNRFGHWKDTAYMIKGPAVFTLTVTFSKIYQLTTRKPFDYTGCEPTTAYESDGFVQPYDDTPLDGQTVSEFTYLNTINRAQKYVYIATPYLVVDNEMLTSLRLTAQSGVDVRIVTPGIPDKRYVYLLTQSYYKVLLEAGVRIFEYTPGFMHAKMFVSDDELAIVGSANMDYRSLYLHFESCGLFYGSSAVKAVKEDFDDFIPRCREVTLEIVKKTPFWKRICQALLKFFAPLM